MQMLGAIDGTVVIANYEGMQWPVVGLAVQEWVAGRVRNCFYATFGKMPFPAIRLMGSGIYDVTNLSIDDWIGEGGTPRIACARAAHAYLSAQHPDYAKETVMVLNCAYRLELCGYGSRRELTGDEIGVICETAIQHQRAYVSHMISLVP